MKGEEKKVPCQHCSAPTPYTATQLCDPCYLARNAVRDRPEVVRKLLAVQDAARGKPTAESMLLEALRLVMGLKVAVAALLGARRDDPLMARIDAFLSVVRGRFNLKGE